MKAHDTQIYLPQLQRRGFINEPIPKGISLEAEILRLKEEKNAMTFDSWPRAHDRVLVKLSFLR